MNNTTLNITDGNYQFSHDLNLSYGIFVSVCLPLIITVNIILLISILSSKKLRQIFWYKTIVCIAIVDLLSGFISYTFQAIDFLYVDNIDCVWYFFYGLIESYAQLCVVLWGVVLLNIDCILKMFRVKRPCLSGWKRTVVVTGLSASPWILFIGVICPLVFYHSQKNTIALWRDNFCPLYREYSADTADVNIILYIPSCIIVVCLLVIGAFMLCRKAACSWVQNYDCPEHPAILVVADLLVLCVVWQWEGLFYVTYVYHSRPWLIAFMVGTVILDIRPFILPVVWMFLPDIKESFKEVRTNVVRYFRRPRLRETLTVSYKHMSEN